MLQNVDSHDIEQMWKTINQLKAEKAEAISLLQRGYDCLYRGHWRTGETDAEWAGHVNDYLCNQKAGE